MSHHHHIRNTCPSCHGVTTCRCSAPKIDTSDLCYECANKPRVTEAKKSPGSKNEFARKAKKMNIPLQMDNKDYGQPTKCVARTIDNVNSATGEFYGSKTIMTKENKQTFVDFLITEGDSDEITTLPEKVIREIKGLMRKGAQDLQQNWKDALELTNKAYHVGNVRKPTPDQKGAWKQYTDLIAFGVQQLSATRGRDGKWRKTEPVAFSESTTVDILTPSPGHSAPSHAKNSIDKVMATAELKHDIQDRLGKHIAKPKQTFIQRMISKIKKESLEEAATAKNPSEQHIGKHRFFIELPGKETYESEVDNMDEIIEQLTNKLRRNGAKLRVEQRNKFGAELSVWVGDVKRDHIKIRDIS